jgi:hypothetical protein
VKTGFVAARDLGFTHVLQVDADGQHDIDCRARVPRGVAQGRPRPRCSRIPSTISPRRAAGSRRARSRDSGSTSRSAAEGIIEDAMVGFRVYPLDAAIDVAARGDRMDFDVEVAVRLAWAGVRIVNLPVGVRYLTADEGGRSHFQPLRDNVRISLLHSWLCTVGCTRWFIRKLGLTPLLRTAIMSAEHRRDRRCPGATSWLTQRERGAVLGIRAITFWATFFGRTPARLVVRMIAALLRRVRSHRARGVATLARGPCTRRACVVRRDLPPRAQLRAGHARPALLRPRRARRHRHSREPATSTFEALVDEKRGAILLGAHLGSFEAMRASSAEGALARLHRRALRERADDQRRARELDPVMAGRVIHVGSDPIGLALKLRERLAGRRPARDPRRPRRAQRQDGHRHVLRKARTASRPARSCSPRRSSAPSTSFSACISSRIATSSSANPSSRRSPCRARTGKKPCARWSKTTRRASRATAAARRTTGSTSTISGRRRTHER